MPKGYTKGDVEFHEERYYGPALPAVNVKRFNYPDCYDVADHFGCSEETAQQALNWAFESTQERFWQEIVQGIAEKYIEPHFGKVQTYSAGRSAGWVVCHGMDYQEHVEDHWDAVDLTAWYAFEKAVKDHIKFCTSWDYVKEMIESNGWTDID